MYEHEDMLGLVTDEHTLLRTLKVMFIFISVGIHDTEWIKLNPSHPDVSMYVLHTVLAIFSKWWQREFVQQSIASLVGDHILCSHDLNVWFRGVIVRRN